ncbi:MULTISPECIES: acyl carrier protein [Photorhabdus]|uniref:Acyl carrier protein n=2 Tax=Photorhabdus TaxID=29487 RepID=A0ABX0ASV9_9GAMM|nr:MULTISPECIES: acyl carrier protein [Photorhabdus]MCC8374825.1 acyl carrier protein [Photorhabdus bodei]MCC8465640.1 acyl carrier protein [Photorhabdus bodei]MCT8352385.1 acyl carrier protein [Photorhabdus kayaii]MDB6368799.1 acyl carrier protein [Photorhabdus bodei]MDB6371024.1 acyl carrier protein [Photorhabdus bodei]
MPTQSDIFTAIKNRILMMKDIEEEEITPESYFASLKFDSLDYVEIQVFVLETYGIMLKAELFSDHSISTLDDLTGYVKSKL